MRHAHGHSVEQCQPLCPVFRPLLGIALELLRHPKFVQCEPARVRRDNTGRGAVTATYDLVYGPAEQEPFLLGQGNWLRLVLAAKSGDTGRGDKQLDRIRLGIARLEISFTVDGEGWIDSFQNGGASCGERVCQYV